MYKYGVGILLFFTLVSKTDGSSVTTGTASAKVNQDGGGWNPVTSAPVYGSDGCWYLTLTNAEMSGTTIGITITHTDAIQITFTIKTETKLVSDLEDLDADAIETACDASLVSYDAPTKAEMDTLETNIDNHLTSIDESLIDIEGTGFVKDTHSLVNLTPGTPVNLQIGGNEVVIS